MGAGQSSQVVLDGDGGCYSVKCRSEPLMVHDRAVLRVTKEELRVLRAVDMQGVYEPKSDSPADTVLTLRWEDVALITLAGRFLSVAQYTPAPVRGGQPGRLVHVFKLRKASNVNSLTNLVRVHSEWRASRPYMDAESIEANLNKSKPPPSMADGPFRVSNSWDKYREEDAPPPNVFARDPVSGRYTTGAPASSNGDAPPPLPPRSSSLGAASRSSSGWTTFNNDVADQQPPSSSRDAPASAAWSTQQPLAIADDPFNTPLSVGPVSNIPPTRLASGPISANGGSPLARMSSGTVREQLARQYSQQYGDGPGTPNGPGSVNQQQSPFSMQAPPASRAAPPPPMSAPSNLIDL